MKCINKWLALGCLGLSILTVGASGQDVRKVKVRVEPTYPEIAKRFRLSGTVKVEVTITPAGTVKSTRVVGGHPVLVESAVEAVKKWKFEPADQETVQIVPFNFTYTPQ